MNRRLRALLGSAPLFLLPALGAVPAAAAPSAALQEDPPEVHLATIREVRSELDDVDSALARQVKNVSQWRAAAFAQPDGWEQPDPGSGRPWGEVIDQHLSDYRLETGSLRTDLAGMDEHLRKAGTAIRTGNDDRALRQSERAAHELVHVTQGVFGSGQNMFTTLGAAEPILQATGNSAGLRSSRALESQLDTLMRQLDQVEASVPRFVFPDIPGDVSASDIRQIRTGFTGYTQALQQGTNTLGLLTTQGSWLGSNDIDPATGMPRIAPILQQLGLGHGMLMGLQDQMEPVPDVLGIGLKSAKRGNELGARASLQYAQRELDVLTPSLARVRSDLEISLAAAQPFMSADQQSLTRSQEMLTVLSNASRSSHDLQSDIIRRLR